MERGRKEKGKRNLRENEREIRIKENIRGDDVLSLLNLPPASLN